MEFIQENYEKFHFINSNPSTKCPCNGYNTKYNLVDWNGKKGRKYKDILPHFKSVYDPFISYGIKHGLQPDGRITMGLDFDIVGKNGNGVKINMKAENLWNEFYNINKDGLWNSGTKGNFGCFCLIQSEKIKQKIMDLNQDKIEVDGVELLFNSHHILPPSKSKCKRTGKLRERVYFNNNYMCIVNEGDKVEEYILKLMETYTKPHKTKPNKTKPNKTHTEIEPEKHTPINNMDLKLDDEDKELADIIDLKYIDNYNDWTKLIWACRVDNNFELAHYISKRGNKYDGDEMATRVIYNDFKESRKGFSKATFYHYAKISNKEKYLEIRAKYHPFMEINSFTDNDLAKTFCKLYGCDHIYYDKSFYFFNGVLWETNETGNKLKLSIANDLSTFYLDEASRQQKILNTITEKFMRDIQKEKIKGLMNIVNKLQNYSTLNNVFGMIKNYIERGCDEVEWETKPYLFAFKNKIYDLKNMTWIEPCRDDYVCVCTGYEWVEPTEEQKRKLHELLDTILPHPDEKKLYATILATGLCGITLEKFINANGSGGNGKGVLNELMETLLGNYAYNCANAVLLQPIKDGNNPTVANMKHKRMIFYREPDTSQSQKLNIATIKELTGGKAINARMNYSNDTKTVLQATHILECNERPKLSGRVDDAVVRRLIDIPFRSVFTANPADYFGEYVFKKDAYYKTNNFQNEYKCVLFSVLLDYWKEYLRLEENIDAFVCDSVKERTNAYLEANDELKTWFDENYEQTGKRDDVLQIKDIYNLFKESDTWSNMSKRERRELNKKAFVEKVSGNIHFRKYFKAREKSKIIQEKYGVKEMRNVIIGFKQYIQECMIDIDED